MIANSDAVKMATVAVTDDCDDMREVRMTIVHNSFRFHAHDDVFE